MAVGNSGGEKILLQLELDVSKLLDGMQKSSERIGLLKKQIERAKLDLSDMEKAGISSGAAFNENANAVHTYEVQLAAATKEQRNYEKQLLLSVQADKAAEGSYEQLLRQFQLASVELKNQEGLIQKNADGTFQLSDAYKVAATKVEQMKTIILQFDQGINDGRTGVGLYKNAIDEAFADFKDSEEKVRDLKLQISQLNDKIKEGGPDQATFESHLKEVTDQLKIQTEETVNLGKKLNDLKEITAEADGQFKSLRLRLQEARDAATAAQDAFSKGIISEAELVKTQEAFGKINKEAEDFRKRIEALQPGGGFKAIGQVATGAAGGLEAASAAMGLLGLSTEATEKALLTFQQLRGLTQGLKEFQDFPEHIKNAGIALGITTVKTEAQAVAQAESAVTATANAGATQVMAAAEVEATVATTGLTFAMKALLGTVGIVLISVAAVATVFNTIDNARKSVDLIVDAVDGENKAHQRTIELLRLKTSESVTAAQGEIDLANQRGASEQDLFNLRENLRKANLKGLSQEAATNNEHLLELVRQREAVEAVLGDTSRKEEDHKKAADQLLKIDEDYQKTRLRNAEITNVEFVKLNTERLVDEIETDRKIIQEQNSLSEKRISVIRNDHEREIEQAKLATKEALDAILDGEADAAEKKALIAEQGEQKIAEINRAFSLKTLQEKNQLSILLTREGTEARIDAEIKASTTERTELLKNDKLTQVERQTIISESENKILALEDNRIKLQQQKADAEIEVERRKQIALQAIRAELSSTPSQSFEADRQAVQENFEFQLQTLENANQRKFEEIKNERDREFQLNIESASDAERQTKEFADRQAKVLSDANKRIVANDEATSLERENLLKKTGNDIVEITQKRINSEATISVLRLQLTQSQIQEELAIVERGSEKEIILKQQLENVKIQIQQVGIDARIRQLDAEREQKGQLGEQELAEYALLLQKKNELHADAGSVRADQEAQANELYKQEANKVIDEIFNRFVQSSQRFTDARIRDINTTLDAELAALDEQQAKEEGTFVAKTQTQIKYDNQRKALRDRAAAEERSLKLKQFETERNAAAIQASIRGAVAFVEALPNYILAAAVGVTTGIEVGFILAQQPPEFYEGGFDRRYGYTGPGNPKGVSQSHSTVDRTIHNDEYIIPSPVLNHPEVNQYVQEVIEPLRVNGRLNSPASPSFAFEKPFPVPLSMRPGYEGGGFAPPLVNLQGTSMNPIDVDAMQQAITASVVEGMRSQPAPVVIVQDISEAQGIVTKVVDRSNH